MLQAVIIYEYSPDDTGVGEGREGKYIRVTRMRRSYTLRCSLQIARSPLCFGLYTRPGRGVQAICFT